MLSEAKIFLESLTHFRQLLNEGVGEGSIVDAINKHKIVYIYYAGDDTIMKGYRTIKPMVLGQTINKDAVKRGENYMLLRAWQDAGNTDSRKIYYDQKGRGKSGWRLFRVDKITSFLPTGRVFSTDRKKFPDIESYNPDDSQMTNIRAAVQIDSGQPQTNVVGNTTAQKLPEPDSAFKGQKEKFQYFSNMGKKQRDITADEVKDLWDYANTQRSRIPRDKLLVVTDEHGDMILKNANQKTEIPPDSIVGNLRDLYIKLVQPSQKQTNIGFFKNSENDTLKEVNKINQPNIQQENTEKKTFFK
jgi:hypothetical protein